MIWPYLVIGSPCLMGRSAILCPMPTRPAARTLSEMYLLVEAEQLTVLMTAT